MGDIIFSLFKISRVRLSIKASKLTRASFCANLLDEIKTKLYFLPPVPPPLQAYNFTPFFFSHICSCYNLRLVSCL